MSFFKRAKEIILVLFARCFVFVLSLVGRVFPFKVGLLAYQRGHLLVDTEYWLRTHLERPRGLYLFVSGRKPYNRQILRMIKRKVLVLESDFIARAIRAFQKRIPDSDVWIPMRETGATRWREWNSAPPQIVIDAADQARGIVLLKDMGIPENDPMVCFFSRDDRYLDEAVGRWGWDYHRYRNSDIANYLPAMEWLTARGYWALRMGALVQRPIAVGNSRMVDYAATCRSDFMDVFLFSHCKFVVGDTAGAMTFPMIFNKPYVQTNCVPLFSLARNANALFILKKYKDVPAGRFLTFREVFTRGMDKWFQAEQYEQAGIEVVENSPEEIIAVVQEMQLRLEARWEPAPEDEMLQTRFREIIPPDHPVKGFVSRVGRDFLRDNKDLLK